MTVRSAEQKIFSFVSLRLLRRTRSGASEMHCDKLSLSADTLRKFADRFPIRASLRPKWLLLAVFNFALLDAPMTLVNAEPKNNENAATSTDKSRNTDGSPIDAGSTPRNSSLNGPGKNVEMNKGVQSDDDSATSRYDFVCRAISLAARQNDLPIAFLTRLIWQESRFEAHAVSPAGARGVAQFMPGTATYLGLADPFDITDAINKSAEYLRMLYKQFGNLGLAAAAYNAGPRRVSDWLATGGGLPLETQSYVLIVTQHNIDDWRPARSKTWDVTLPDSITCPKIVKFLSDRPEQISKSDKATPSPAPVSAWGLQLAGGSTKAAALAAYFDMGKPTKPFWADVSRLCSPRNRAEGISGSGCASRRRTCS